VQDEKAGPRVGQVIVLEGKAFKVEAVGRRFATLTPVGARTGVRRYVELTALPGPDAA